MGTIEIARALFDKSNVLIIAGVFGLWLLISNWKWLQRQWKFMIYAAIIEGPSTLPFVGNAHLFYRRDDELLDQVIKLFKPWRYPFRFWMGSKLFLGISTPRDIETVINHPMAVSKPSEYRFLAEYLGHGLVTNSGATHRVRRKLILPMVNGKNINNFMECFDRQSRRCVECLESRAGTGEFDIMEFMDDCTFDIILETIMGVPGTVQDGDYKGLIHHCAKAIMLAHERGMKVWLYPDWAYYRTAVGREFKNSMALLNEFTEKLVAQKKNQYTESPKDFSEQRKSAVLDRLITHNMQHDVLLNDTEMRDEISNVWKPAQDPTALTSSFLFVMLGMHPEVQEKVRAEVLEVVGNGNITIADIGKLKYLDMVFRETVRLFPVGPIVLRKLTDDVDFDTCTAPKGCTVAILLYQTHRDPKYWKDPEKFNPERFLPENSEGRHPFAFIPFSAGVRGCIGRQYATTMVKTLAARVIQKYKIHSEGSLESLRLKIGVSIRSIDGYKVSITKI
ncbi:cytochrome P450 4C1-like [Athalia rosae]|uniref:cytochrome P450 4C1-like n=1 Tax=Athalia rosae TaxID=37344 RepID=UPI002033619A|nr:cytochrome P450 4C1-like [Athalia rosae]